MARAGAGAAPSVGGRAPAAVGQLAAGVAPAARRHTLKKKGGFDPRHPTTAAGSPLPLKAPRPRPPHTQCRLAPPSAPPPR